jgi:hypothetical protein
LIAKIYLTPRKKYSFGTSLDVTHSNIQDIIALSVSETIRNVFNGAETLELSARGNIGSSKDLANPNNQLFNVSGIRLDLKLSFPRIFMPFSTEKSLKKNDDSFDPHGCRFCETAKHRFRQRKPHRIIFL